MINDEFLEGKDFVKCELCGECMKQLHNHIIKTHKITLQCYNNLFPNSKISSDVSIESKKSAKIKRNENLKSHHYKKRFVYLMPDGTYASKTDVYKRAWNTDCVNPQHIFNAQDVGYVARRDRMQKNGIEGEDYVRCKICGQIKGSITQHIRKFHNMTVKQYMEAYPDSQVHCNKVKKAFSEASKKKWQTQFANGTSVPSQKKEVKHKKSDDITKEILQEYFKEGYTCSEISRKYEVSSSTISNLCKKFSVEIPSVSVMRIRKAVKDGAEFNLQTDSLEHIQSVLNEFGKSKTLIKYGVERDLFNSWLNKLINKI